MKLETWQRNLAGLWIAQTLTMVAFSFFFPFIPLYIQHLGVRDVTAAAQWAGVIAAAAAISMAVVQPVWGNLSDRWGRKPMVIRSMASAAVITALMGLCTSVEQLLVLRVLQGVFTGTVAASNALVATTTPRYRLGFALGLMQVAIFAGTSVGPLVGGVISDSLGFRPAFFGAAALMLVGSAVVLAFVREGFVRPTAGAARESVWTGSRTLLAVGLFPTMLGVIFLIQLGNLIVAPVLSLFIADLSGGQNAATAAGMVLGATGAVSAASALILGRVSDRVGQAVILPVCLAGAAISYFPQALVQQVWQLLLLRMLLGVFLGGLMPTANAVVAAIVPKERRGVAFGLAATANAMASAVGPLSGAGITTHFGIREVFVATGTVFAVACVGVTLSFRRLQLPRPRPQSPPARDPGAPTLSSVEGARAVRTAATEVSTTMDGRDNGKG